MSRGRGTFFSTAASTGPLVAGGATPGPVGADCGASSIPPNHLTQPDPSRVLTACAEGPALLGWCLGRAPGLTSSRQPADAIK